MNDKFDFYDNQDDRAAQDFVERANKFGVEADRESLEKFVKYIMKETEKKFALDLIAPFNEIVDNVLFEQYDTSVDANLYEELDGEEQKEALEFKQYAAQHLYDYRIDHADAEHADDIVYYAVGSWTVQKDPFVEKIAEGLYDEFKQKNNGGNDQED